MKRFHGNVDLYHRPVVSSEAMNNAGYNIPAGNTATVYSMQRGIRDKSGRVREVLYTPITATGEVMSQKDIDAYIDGLDGSDDILAADKAGKGMIIHLDANPNGNDGQDLHLMQEAYGRGPQQTQQTQPGYTVLETERPGRKTRYKLGVPGATVYPAGVPHLGEKPKPTLRIPQQTATDTLDPAAGNVEIPRRTHQTSGGDTAMPVRSATQPGQVATPNPQQSSGTVNQATPNQVPQVADMNGLLELLARDSKRKLDEETETDEQKAAREKREKRQALLAKIGDGLGAFHEAYSYMMGNKPMTSGSLSAAQEARIKALGLERDKKYKDALDNYIKVLETQRKEDYYKSIADTRRAQQESLDRDREEKRKMQKETNDARVALYKARMGKYLDESSYTLAYNNAIASGYSEADAIKAGLAASAANQEELARQQKAESDAKVKAGEAQANQRNAAANASNARAAKTKAGGRSSGSTYTTTTTTYDKNGKVKGTKVTTKTPGGSRSSKNPTSRSNSKKKTNVKWK